MNDPFALVASLLAGLAQGVGSGSAHGCCEATATFGLCRPESASADEGRLAGQAEAEAVREEKMGQATFLLVSSYPVVYWALLSDDRKAACPIFHFILWATRPVLGKEQSLMG